MILIGHLFSSLARPDPERERAVVDGAIGHEISDRVANFVREHVIQDAQLVRPMVIGISVDHFRVFLVDPDDFRASLCQVVVGVR